MNEFLECHIVHIVKPFFSFSGFTTVQPKKKAKVSSDGSKARGGNCDTRLEIVYIFITLMAIFVNKISFIN